MRHSIELLKKLHERYPDKSERALCEALGYTGTALQGVQRLGKMSPEMAALVASEVGEDPQHWALIAAAEGAKNPSVKRRLTALLTDVKKERFRALYKTLRRASVISGLSRQPIAPHRLHAH